MSLPLPSGMQPTEVSGEKQHEADLKAIVYGPLPKRTFLNTFKCFFSKALNDRVPRDGFRGWGWTPLALPSRSHPRTSRAVAAQHVAAWAFQ